MEKKRDRVIVYSGTGEEERRWNKRGLGLLVLVLYFYAGIFGSVFGFLSIFPVDLNRSIIVAGILLIGLFYLLMYFSGSRFRIMLALTGATYLFWCTMKQNCSETGQALWPDRLRRW